MSETQPHIPVMMPEVLAALAPKNGETYIDGTLGAGGYTRAILDAADCRVIAFDRDPDAIAAGRDWGKSYGERLTLVNHPFADLERAVSGRRVDGVVFDLGVSSMQLDQADRGFSFRYNGPLSMRMDRGKPDAADLVNNAAKEDLAKIMKVYGEERHAGRIAGAIVKARANAPIKETAQLAAIIERASPSRPQDKIHPATRAFQAFRIFVNDELGQIALALHAVERVLHPGGRLVVVTFHSLEDRLVKKFITSRTDSEGQSSRHAPPILKKAPSFEKLGAKFSKASANEIKNNPRSRSATLRASRRTSEPAWIDDVSAFVPSLLISALEENWR